MKNLFKINKNINYRKKTGFTVIEVLIACVIISTIILAVTAAASKGIELSNRALRQVQASMLIEEGIEAVRSIRDTNWTTISTLDLDTDYFLSFDINLNTWSLSKTPVEKIDGIFERIVRLYEVNRDINDDISLSGTIDDEIKKVEVVVNWPSKGETISKKITFYLANIFN